MNGTMECNCVCCKSNKITDEYVYIYPDTFQTNGLEVKYQYNSIRTTKYRFYTFIFLNIFEQLKRYSNIFFILCVVLNFIPNVDAFSKQTSFLMIAIVILITMFKDGIEDLQRWRSDCRINDRQVLKYDKCSMTFKAVTWKEIKTGDFVKISSDERVPADLLVYYCSNASGTCFVETSDLDGETNLKKRSIFKINGIERNLEKSLGACRIMADYPNKEIYKFKGKILEKFSDNVLRNVSSNHLVLREMILRNTDEIRGIVVYAGNETKVFMNNIKPRFKRSLLEAQLNRDNLWCLGILFVVCLASAVGNSLWINSFPKLQSVVFYVAGATQLNDPIVSSILVFIASIIIYQSIIPLPLYVSMELVKAHQIRHITSDLNFYDEKIEKNIEVKAFNITEDLGQINHIFCDKTGTLTENEMIFREASIRGTHYTVNNTLLQPKVDADSSEFYPDKGSLEEFLLMVAICNTTVIRKTVKKEKEIIHCEDISPSENLHSLEHLLGIKEYKTDVINPIQMEVADSIPNDLTVSNPETSESILSSYLRHSANPKVLQKPISCKNLIPLIFSESPDEDALVKMASYNGFLLQERNVNTIFIWSESNNKWLLYDILRYIPFDSDRKCMSIIVRNTHDGVITMFTKGADSVMFDKISNDCNLNDNQKLIDVTKHHVNQFARAGLRTLVMAKKVLTEKEFEAWETGIRRIEEDFGDGTEEIMKRFTAIETDLTLLGATGIEDKLQENVPEVLECFKEAGMNVWILTGDKQETAINIAYSSKLFAENDSLLIINGETEEKVSETLRNHRLTMESSLYRDELKRTSCGQEAFENKSYGGIDEPLCSHTDFALVIDSTSLSIILESEALAHEFVHVTYFCSSVVCCRCTPFQKSQVVALIKEHFDFRTLAIGDGANDVNMIRTADIGVGIGGKEGRQAAFAADFCITQFQHLKRLLFVHGHWSYDKLARMSLYIFYKDLYYSLTMFWYQILCGFSSATAVDQIMQALFHLIPTGLPPVILGIWDSDFDDRILMANPQIFKTGITSRTYRPRDFWRNILDAIWQSLCTFIVLYLCYSGTEVDMGEFGIITLNVTTISLMVHILVESKHWNPFCWCCCIGCLVLGLYLVLYAENSLCVVFFNCYSNNPYQIFQQTLTKGKTYVVTALVISLTMLPRIFVKAVLFSSKNSISYLAQQRIDDKNRKHNEIQRQARYTNIPRSIHNIKRLRKDNEFDVDYQYKMNHKDSFYYLGNLEQFKVNQCRKCDFGKREFSL